MNNDSHLLYEAYKKTCLEYVDPDASEAVRKDKEDRQRDKERKRDYSGRGYRSNYGPQGDYPSSRSAHYADDEDEESTHCSYAKKGCKCSECEECRANQTKSEDAETYGIEGKLKAALEEVESCGYSGDHINPMEVAKLVLGHQGDWGDSYGSLLQALGHVIEAYHEKGLQDS